MTGTHLQRRTSATGGGLRTGRDGSLPFCRLHTRFCTLSHPTPCNRFTRYTTFLTTHFTAFTHYILHATHYIYNRHYTTFTTLHSLHFIHYRLWWALVRCAKVQSWLQVPASNTKSVSEKVPVHVQAPAAASTPPLALGAPPAAVPAVPAAGGLFSGLAFTQPVAPASAAAAPPSIFGAGAGTATPFGASPGFFGQAAGDPAPLQRQPSVRKGKSRK